MDYTQDTQPVTHNPNQPRDTFWRETDRVLGEGKVAGEKTRIHMSLQQTSAAYRDHFLEDFAQLAAPEEMYVTVRAMPYVLVPELTLTLPFFLPRRVRNTIGSIARAYGAPLYVQEIGTALAWYSPTNRVIVLWDCYLFDDADPPGKPHQSATLATVWTGFETILQDMFPRATRIVTPDGEPTYDYTDWQAFLQQQGYTPNQTGSLHKALPRH